MFYYGFGYFSYFPLYLLAILVVAIASSSVRSAYQKYSRVRNERMMTGEQAARRILQIAHLDDVDIQYARGGALSDHYDPRRKIVALSKACYEDDSLHRSALPLMNAGMPFRMHRVIFSFASVMPWCQSSILLLSLAGSCWCSDFFPFLHRLLCSIWD